METGSATAAGAAIDTLLQVLKATTALEGQAVAQLLESATQVVEASQAISDSLGSSLDVYV